MRSSKTIADHPVAALLSALLVADGSRSCYELDGAVHCRDEKHYFREKARREVRELEDSYSRNQRKSLTVPREHQEEPADRKVDMQGQVLETKNCERSLLMTNHNAVTYRRPFRFSAMNEGGISALQALPSSETQQLRRSYRLQRSEEPKTRKNAVNQFDSICVPHVRSEEAHAIRFSGGFLDVATELAHVAAMFTVGTHSEMRAEVDLNCLLSSRQISSVLNFASDFRAVMSTLPKGRQATRTQERLVQLLCRTVECGLSCSEVVTEMIAGKGGEQAKWKAVALIECGKSCCRLVRRIKGIQYVFVEDEDGEERQVDGAAIVVAEILHVVRPAIYALLRCWSPIGLTPFLLSLALDGISLGVLHSYRETHKATPQLLRKQLAKRRFALLYYFLREPLYSASTKRAFARLRQILSNFALGKLLIFILDMVESMQRYGGFYDGMTLQQQLNSPLPSLHSYHFYHSGSS